MKGRSRKKKTDWDAVRVQILVTVLSGAILKVIEVIIERIADKFFSTRWGRAKALSCNPKYNTSFHVGKDG